MFGKELEIILVTMECLAIVGFVSVVGGMGYGIYKLVMWLI